MKTTNVILIGVLGVGAVGAYMFLKNKKAKDALLSGSLPATNQGGATTPSGTTTPTKSGAPTITSGAETPLIPTPILTEKVEINKDTNLDAYNLQNTLEQLKNLDIRGSQPLPKQFIWGQLNPNYDSANYYKFVQYPKDRAIVVEKLAKLGYKFDKGLLIKI